MRIGVGAVVVLLCMGCAPKPMLTSFKVAPTGIEPFPRAVAEREQLRACFDALVQRHRLDEPIEAALHFLVHERAARLLQIQPRNRATVVDDSLTQCVQDESRGWQLDGDGAFDVVLRLIPRPLPPQTQPLPSDAALASRFHPQE
jgi:hypothetical protein